MCVHLCVCTHICVTGVFVYVPRHTHMCVHLCVCTHICVTCVFVYVRVLQLEGLGLIRRGTYKVSGGGYSRLDPSKLDIFEDTKNVDVIHLPHTRPDGPEVK